MGGKLFSFLKSKKSKEVEEVVQAANARLNELGVKDDEVGFHKLVVQHHITDDLEANVEWWSTQETPLLRLLVSYMLIEQLSDKFHVDNSALSSFTYKLLRQEIDDAKWVSSFGMYGDNEETRKKIVDKYFVRNPFWATDLRRSISTRYALAQGMDERCDIGRELCSELLGDIDDPDLMARFIDLARDALNESGDMTAVAEEYFLSMEL